MAIMCRFVSAFQVRTLVTSGRSRWRAVQEGELPLQGFPVQRLGRPRRPRASPGPEELTLNRGVDLDPCRGRRLLRRVEQIDRSPVELVAHEPESVDPAPRGASDLSGTAPPGIRKGCGRCTTYNPPARRM